MTDTENKIQIKWDNGFRFCIFSMLCFVFILKKIGCMSSCSVAASVDSKHCHLSSPNQLVWAKSNTLHQQKNKQVSITPSCLFHIYFVDAAGKIAGKPEATFFSSFPYFCSIASRSGIIAASLDI